MPFIKPEIVVPTLEERQASIFSRLSLTQEKTGALVNQLEEFLTDGLYKRSVEVGALESFVERLPSARLTATVAVLCVNERDVTACRVDLAGGRAIVGSMAPVQYKTAEGKSISLLEAGATATILMRSCVQALQLLMQRDEDTRSSHISVYVSSQFPLQMGDKTSAIFLNFHELCPTLSDDPIEGTDLSTLLNIGMERSGLHATVAGIVSSSVALLLAGEYERASREPRCLLSTTVDEDVSFAFALPDDFTRQLDLRSRVLEVDLSGYRGCRQGNSEDNFVTHQLLPRCAHDFEIDFAECNGKAEFRRFERLVGGRYLGEMVRRLLVRVFQHTCPQAVWTPNTLGFEDALTLMNGGAACTEVCKQLWRWDVPKQGVAVVQRCAEAVVRRSAAALACVLAVLAKRTGRLQPALGGCSLALQGKLGRNERYQQFIRDGLDAVFQKDTASLIHFVTVEDAQAKGAAILGAMRNNCM